MPGRRLLNSSVVEYSKNSKITDYKTVGKSRELIEESKKRKFNIKVWQPGGEGEAGCSI